MFSFCQGLKKPLTKLNPKTTWIYYIVQPAYIYISFDNFSLVFFDEIKKVSS